MDLRFTLVLAVVAVANAGPVNVRQNSQCSTQCVGTSKFSYTIGATYRYDYEGSIQTTIFGASEGASGMRLKATADFEVIDSCDLALRLRNVRLEETDKTGRAWAVLGADSFRRALEEHPLRFSWQDGRIEEVCPIIDAELPWVTNVKRGILSSFQNTMDDLQKEDRIPETDVAGNCRADYKIMSRQYTTITVNKTKDLLACTDRHGFKTAMQATPYRVPSDIQSLPLTKSSHECVQTLSTVHGHLMKADCEEHHIFRPFSKGHNGAMTHAKHSLNYVGTTPGVRTSLTGNIRRSDMLFEHEKETPKTNSNAAGSVISTLNTICEKAQTDVRPETPRLFSDLVYKMKELEPLAMRQLQRQVISKRVCRTNHEAAKKFFHDAVPMTGTPASVNLISDLINHRSIRGSEADMWVSSLAFIQNPTKEMLDSVKDLLLAPNPSRTTYLAGSALINSYCKKNPSCDAEPTIRQIQSLLERNLNTNCKVSSRNSQEQMIVSMKALGNMANAPSTADTLARCFTEETNPIEIRLTALETLRRQPCSADRSQALRLYVDSQKESEIRIQAYITAMSCATEDTIKAVERTLNAEKVNQVGSFVWTHLTNLMETSDPHKQRIRRILDNTNLQKTFDLDKRKYSRNFEASMFFDSINTGAKVEGNLIWSTKSYIPRSAMFNMTLDLFGHSVNFLEFGGRAEGLEHMVEKYFNNRDGYFSDSNVDDVLKRRGKRSVSDDKMNLIDNQFTEDTKVDPKGSLYFKIFGQEIRYFDFKQIAGAGDFNVLELLIKLASNHDINFSKNIMFLDTTMTIPTVLGLPLKLSINGTATINMQIKGKMDIKRIHPSPRNIDITGAFKPSVAVEVSSLMSVDANVARTGLKMVTTLHSSTAIEGTMQIQDSQVVNVKFEMPRDKVEIISAENKFFIVHQTQEVEQRMIDSNRVNSKKCTGDKLAKVLGLEFCGEISYPTTPDMSDVPVFPMTGPAKMSVVLNKKDTHTSYDFEAVLKTTKVRKNGLATFTHEAKLGFNTPGSQVDREFLFDFLLNRGDKALNFELKTPWKKANLNGALVTEDDLKRATLRLMIDETREYSVVAELQTDNSDPEKKTYTPNIEIRIPEKNPILITGSVTYSMETNKHLEYHLNVDQLFTTPVTMRGAIRKEVLGPERDKYTTNFNLESPKLKTSLNGFLDNRADNYKSRMTINYQWERRRQETISLNFKGRNSLSVTMRKLLFDTAVSLSAYPKYNTHVKWSAETTDTHFETSIDLKYGPDPNDRRKRLSASTILNYEKHGPKFNADAKLKMFFPAQNIDLEVSGKHHHDSHSLETKAEVEYKPGKRINALLNLMRHDGRHMKYSGSASLVYPGREMAISTKIERTRPKEYHTSSRIQWQRSREIKETSMFKYDEPHSKYIVESEIEIPDNDPITIEGSLIPKFDDFTASLKVNALKELYSGDVAYNFAKGPGTFTGAASADIVYPGRRITADSDVRLVMAGESTVKMDVKWDADRDNSKTVVIDGVHSMTKYGRDREHKGTLTIMYPGRTVLIQAEAKKYGGEYKSHALIDWQSDKIQMDVSMVNTKNARSRSLSGSIKFTSPFRYVEEIGAGFMYNSDGETYRTGGNVTWAPGKTITANALLTKESLKDMEGSANIETPFSGFTKMGLKGKFLLQDKELSFILGGEAEDKRIEAELTGQYKDVIKGAVKVDLPFLPRTFGASFTHKREANQYETGAEVMWDRSNTGKIRANLDMNIESVKDFSGTLQLETPFQPVTRLSVLLTHKIDGSEMTSKLTGNVEGQEMTMEIKGKKGPNRRDMEGSIRITTPFENFDDMSLSLKHNDDTRIFTSSMSAAWQRTKRVTASFTMKHERNGWVLNNEGKIQITTPYIQFQRVGYEWKHSNTESDLESDHTFTINDIKWGVNLGGNLRLTNGFRIYATVGLKVPYEEIRRINSAFEFEINKQKLVSALTVSSLGRRAAAGFRLTGASWREMEGSANLDISAFIADETPFVAAPISIEMKTDAIRMPYTGFIEMKNADDIWRLDVNTSPRSWRSFVVKATVATPSDTMVLDASHLLNRDSSQSTISLNYKPDKTITIHVQSNFEGYDKIKGDLTLTTPFDVIQSFKMGIDHDMDYRGFTDKATFEYDSTSGKTSFATGLTYYGSRYISGNIMLTSPYENFERFETRFTHTGQTRKVESNVYVEYLAGQKIDAKSVIEFDPVRATLTLTTPFAAVTSASLTAQHDAELDGPETTSSFNFLGTIYGEQTQISGSATMQSYSLVTGNVHLVTPYENVRDVSGQFRFNLEDDKLLTTIGVDMGSNKKINLVLTCAIPAYSGSLTITTPFQGYQEMKLGYGYESTLINELPHVKVEFNCNVEQKFETLMKVELEGVDKWKAMVDVKTPLVNHRRYLLNMDYEKKNQEVHEIGAVLEYPGAKNELTFMFQRYRRSQPLKLKLTVKTPYFYLTSLTLDLEHKGVWSKFDHNMVFDYDAYVSRVHIENKWNVDGWNHITGDAHLTSPIKHFEYTAFSIHHNKDDHEVTSSATLEYSPGKRINIKNEVKFEDKFEVDFELTTPFEYGKVAAVKIEHEGGLKPRKTEVTLEFDSIKITGDLEIETERSINGEVKFTSRFEGYERITIKASHDMSHREAMTELEIKLPNSEEIKLDITTKPDREALIKVDLHTPFEALSDAHFEYSDDTGVPPKFKLSLFMTNWGKRVQLDGNFRFTYLTLTTFVGNLDFSSPYEGYEHISLSFSNLSPDLHYETKIELDLSHSKKIELNAIVNVVNPAADISLVTPFSPVRRAAFKYKLEKRFPKKLIKSLVEIEHESDKGFSKLRSDWKIENWFMNVDGEVRLTTPYKKCKLLSLEYEYRIRSDDTGGTKKLTMNYNTKKIEYTAGVERSNGKLVYSDSLKTPWEYARDVRMNIEITDPMTEDFTFKNFHYKGEMTHNMWTKKSEGEIEWTITEDQWSGMVKASSDWYDRFFLTFSHEKKGLRWCVTAITSTLATEKLLEYNSEFNLQSLEYFKGTIVINFPVPDMSYRTNKIAFSHDGNLEHFKTSALYDTNSFGKYAAELEWDTPSLSGVLKFDTPLTGWETIHLDFNHRGTMTDFTNAITASTPTKELSISTTFKLSPTLTLDVKVKTPFDLAREMSLVYTHEGNWDKFECNANMNYNNEKTVTGKLQFQQVPTINVRIDLATPFEDFTQNHIEVTHNGGFTGFRSTIDAKIKEPVTGHVDFRMTDTYSEVSLRTQLTTPFQRFEDTSVEILYTTEANVYEATGKVKYNGGQTINAKVDLETAPRVVFKATLETPFTGFESNVVEAGYSGNSRRWSANGKVTTYRNAEGGFNLDFINYQQLQTTLTVTTPFTGYESMTAKLTHNGDLASFRTEATYTDARNEKMEALVEFTNNPITLKAKFLSYFMDLNVEHSGDYTAFQTSGSLAIPRMTLKTDAMFNMRSYVARLNVDTPWTNVKISHNGHYRKFTSNITAIRTTGEKYSVIGSFDMGPKLVILMVNCPYGTVNVNHNGPITAFQSRAQVTYSDKTISAMALFNKNNKMIGAVTFTSPFRHLENLALNFTHFGNTRQFKTEGFVQWQADKRINGKVDFKRSRRHLATTIMVHTPFDRFENLALNIHHHGPVSQFRTTVSVVYMTQKRITATVNYQHLNRGTFTFSSPIQHLESIAANFHTARVNSKKGYHAELSWAPQKTITMDVTGSYDGVLTSASASGYMKMRTPFPKVAELVVAMEHSHSRSYLGNTLEVEHNSAPFINTNIIGRRGHGDDSINVEGTMSAPWPLKATVQLTNEAHEKGADIEVNWDTTRNDKKATVALSYSKERGHSLRVTAPQRVFVITSNIDKTSTRFVHVATVSLDGKGITYTAHVNNLSGRDNTDVNGIIMLAMPFRTLKSVYKYQRSTRQINLEYDWFWNFAVNPNSKAGLRLKVNDYKQTYGANFELTLLPPRMSTGITLRNNVNKRNGLIDTKTEFVYSEVAGEKITLITLWAAAPTGPHTNYTGMMQLTHPRTLTDVKLEGHMGTSYSRAAAGAQLHYLTGNRQLKNIRLMAEIDHVKDTLTLQAETPMKTVHMVGKKVSMENGFLLTHQSVHDGEDSVSSSLKLDMSVPSFDYVVNYDPENMDNVFKMYGKYLSNKEVVYETFRQHNSRHISEIYLSARLNSSRVLHSRIHWRPTLWSDIKRSTLALFHDSHPLMQAWQEVKDAVAKEIELKTAILDAAIPDIAPAKRYISNEVESFKQDALDVVDKLEKMYEANEFFMKDIAAAADKALKYLEEKTTVLGYKLRQRMANLRRTLRNKMVNIRRAINELNEKIEKGIAAVVLKFRPAWQNYAYSVIKSYEGTAQKINEGWEDMLESADQSWTNFVQILDDRFDYISFKFEGYLQKIKDFQDTLRAKLMASKPKRWLDQIRDQVVAKLKEWKAEWEALFADIKSTVCTWYTNVSTAFNEKMDAILGHKYAQIVIRYLQAAKQKMIDRFNKWQLKTKFVEWAKKTYADLKVYAKAQFKKLVDNFMRLENTGFTVFDPRNGEIQFELWLPLELNTLREFPDISIETLKQEWTKLKNKYWPDSDYSFWDTYYKFKPNTDYRDWIPPFKASAMLTHGRHFTTFDGENFDFAGTCSYLLTKDFTDGNFSVVVNYDNGKKTSIIVKSNDKEIEIFPDFKVSVENQRTELPYQHKNTTVTRSGYSIRVHNAHGFTMTCDMANDICTFNVTGWYFGKMAGLLGTYNNEQYDEKLTADRRIVEDIEQFTRSWEVGRYCHVSRNLARQVTTTKGSETDKICRKYFEDDNSVFRRCFKQVKPTAYLKNCISDIEQDYTSRSTEEKGCGIFASYVSACRKFGVPIRIPSTCVKCSGPDGKTFSEGDSKKLNASRIPSAQSADVVFVVEEKGCNRDAAAKLADMGLQIENALKARGLNNNRFALIGFGGQNVHNIEQTHTTEGKLFNDARKLHLAINSLNFNGAGSNTDMLRAVKFASTYPFRTGVSKNVIILPCSACKAQDVGYGEMQQLLTEKDITMHVLMAHDFVLRTISPVKTSYIFGLDERAVFTNKDVNTPLLRGDSLLKNQVIMPKDICVTLALESNGTVFNIQKLLQGRYSTQKAFLDVFARRLANSAHPTECQICECTPDSNGVGRSVCSDCNTPTFSIFFKFLPQQLKRTAVQYNYGPETTLPRLSESPSDFEIEFEEYITQESPMQTIRRH